MLISDVLYQPVSMITHDDLQRINIFYATEIDLHLYLYVYRNGVPIAEKVKVAFQSGGKCTYIMLPKAEEDFVAEWKLFDMNGKNVSSVVSEWKKPREWNFYVMLSSHTDIGLHNSQYIQRYNSEKLLERAMEHCDLTENEREENKYRYVMEGTWFWNNYAADHGKKATSEIVDKYIRPGKIGLCAGIAGNHTQTFGLEEMCRSTYGRRRQKEMWELDLKTFAMVDNNGLTWSMVQPYADAGYENVFFAPNQWNPLPSTVWKCNTELEGFMFNPEAGGGGSRIDVRYRSEHPMVFWWWDEHHKKKLLVWCSTMYRRGGKNFGMSIDMQPSYNTLITMENACSKQLPLMDCKFPYDVWMFACYADDQEPDMGVTGSIKMWNEKWKFPKMQTLGNPDEPFKILKERFGDKIPEISGDITGGWYQHPLAAAEILSKKKETDRLLPTAEKLAVLASIIDGNYEYPMQEFERAWEAILLNDEHSYGTSGYKGRRVYETWMQHRDWIEKAHRTAEKVSAEAIKVIADNADTKGKKNMMFNPTLHDRMVNIDKKSISVPPLGYVMFDKINGEVYKSIRTSVPPVIENEYYKIEFSGNGSISSIYDKELNRNIIKPDSQCNLLMYTSDNHKSFKTPVSADFEIYEDDFSAGVIAEIRENICGAKIIQKVSLPKHEKIIEIDNKIEHAKEMVNDNRYYRYLYYAFPFDVSGCRRFCNLNGCTAEYGKDVTGHGTDVYMAANEWCCAENDEFGVALFQKDSSLTEFGRIYKDKTDYRNLSDGSEMYSYLANDWMQMHLTGGTYLNFRFRYAITSYSGSHTSANIEKKAELYMNPCICMKVPEHGGKLPQKFSFMNTDKPIRLLTLKVAEDSDGFVARFFGKSENLKINLLGDTSFKRVSVDEKDTEDKAIYGFAAYKLNRIGIKIKPYTDRDIYDEDYCYTGLITSPCASCGENSGHLYLLWGKDMREDLSHYEVYRSEEQGFKPGADTFAANAENEEYRVARYEDTGLKKHTKYYYRVRSVYTDGTFGKFSREFCGITKEEQV